jgi:hypothetical protein
VALPTTLTTTLHWIGSNAAHKVEKAGLFTDVRS